MTDRPDAQPPHHGGAEDSRTGAPPPLQPARPSDTHSPGGAEDSHAEQVLSQALRVMAGGGKAPAPTNSNAGSGANSTQRRLTTGQMILLAAIVGLLIGICAGFVSLML